MTVAQAQKRPKNGAENWGLNCHFNGNPIKLAVRCTLSSGGIYYSYCHSRCSSLRNYKFDIWIIRPEARQNGSCEIRCIRHCFPESDIYGYSPRVPSFTEATVSGVSILDMCGFAVL